jgi:hypothetical protein
LIASELLAIVFQGLASPCSPVGLLRQSDIDCGLRGRDEKVYLMVRLLSGALLVLGLSFVSDVATAQSAADRELRPGTPHCVEVREERDRTSPSGGTYYRVRGTNCSTNHWIVRVCTAGRDNREGCASLYLRAGGRDSTTMLSFNGSFYVRGHRPYRP